MISLLYLEPFPFRWNRNGALAYWFDAFSYREPVSTPHQVRGRLSLENALASVCVNRIGMEESYSAPQETCRDDLSHLAGQHPLDDGLTGPRASERPARSGG